MKDTVRFFAYDSSGRLTTYADSLSADSLICVPDPHGQDGEHCTPSGGWTFVAQSNYTYDSANNRTDLGAVLTLGNRATIFNGYTLTYDNVGNLTHKSKTGFDQYYYWNSIGQLDSVLTNGAKVSFLYDGQGRRVAKLTGLDLRYIYSGGQLIAEVDSSNTTIAQDIYRYYPGVDNPHSVKAVSGTYYYLSAIGTPGVAGLIDSTGKIKNRYRYNPWGGLEDSVETVTNVLKFAGREYDSETHLYFNRARYYDPQVARFISEDPTGQSGGSNQYAYAGNDPVGATDPSGECWNTNGDYIPEADGSCPHLSGGGPVFTLFGHADGWWAEMYGDINAGCAGFSVTQCGLVTKAIADLKQTGVSSCQELGSDASMRLQESSLWYDNTPISAPGQADAWGHYEPPQYVLTNRGAFAPASWLKDGVVVLYPDAFSQGLNSVFFILAHEEAHAVLHVDDGESEYGSYQDPFPSTNAANTNPASAWADYCVGAYNGSNPNGDSLTPPTYP